ncbi:MAG: tyrosine--tRNA ligase [Candidatus Eisenbacteria bacterium]|nr:tyrosine--tRNA ligase [Candidatus Eisenbacteria bacterium]
MATKTMSIEEQLKVLMRGTRFADEEELADGTTAGGEEGQSLRRQMEGELRAKLKEGRPLRVYLGVDPTSTNLHVGHFVPLQKLRKFQDQGHQAIFLIGDYTATIGDPSGRDSERRRLTHEDVMGLAKTYAEQAFRVLDPQKTEVRYNGEWLAQLSFADVIELASIFPMKQIVARRDFQARMSAGESLRFHEALYALMQGYDAYALKCDVQVGAYDQHFNMLAGRQIQEHFDDTPHVMITTPIIIGTDGRKMSKSCGNTIDIYDTPFDMYGKTMRISDECIPTYLELASTFPPEQIDRMLADLEGGENPMQIKKRLARNLVEQYHGAEAAEGAQEKFRTVVQDKAAPEDVPAVRVPPELLDRTWVEILAGLALTKSKGEARRLITQGGFYVEQIPVRDVETIAEIPSQGVVVRLGKRRYIRLTR